MIVIGATMESAGNQTRTLPATAGARIPETLQAQGSFRCSGEQGRSLRVRFAASHQAMAAHGSHRRPDGIRRCCEVPVLLTPTAAREGMRLPIPESKLEFLNHDEYISRKHSGEE